MSEKKIKLEEIINNLQNSHIIKSSQSLTIDFKIAMLLFGEQLLELAAENAKIHYTYDDLGVGGYQCDKDSILDTIKQIE